MSHIVLRGHWCDIIVLKKHEPNKEDGDCSKDGPYEDLEQAFLSFTKNHMKILLENFNAKFGTEDIFQLRVRNDSLFESSNLKCFTKVNFPT
jgi:hypothetical protein